MPARCPGAAKEGEAPEIPFRLRPAPIETVALLAHWKGPVLGVVGDQPGGKAGNQGVVAASRNLRIPSLASSSFKLAKPRRRPRATPGLAR